MSYQIGSPHVSWPTTKYISLLSSVLYGCESWLTQSLSDLSSHYMTAVKLLLGVRRSTPNIICLLEAGLPELPSIILKHQCNFISKYMRWTNGEEPLQQILQLCRSANMPMFRRLMFANEYTLHSLEPQCAKCRMQQTS